MIRLKILSGKMAGTEKVVRHFPFSVGRASESDLSLQDLGVWDRHFQLDLRPPNVFFLSTQSNTSVVIEGKSLQETPLRNGDIIEFGSVKILFGLDSTFQKKLAVREIGTWTALGTLFLAQGAIIYLMLRSF